jgi:hypothetical protein
MADQMKPRYSGWIILVLLIALSMVVSCSLYQQKRQNHNCKALFDIIEHGWYRDAAYGRFPMKLGTQNGLDASIGDCHECLIGLPQREFERLFGKADTAMGSHLAYFLTEPCNTSKGVTADGCYYLDCILDVEKKVKGVTVAMDQYQMD